MGEEFLAEVERLSGAAVRGCYQCGKCSGNCPMAPEMDVLPSQMVRLVQLGWRDEALAAESVWICDACQTCSTRCPRGIDVAAVFDALKMLSPRRDDETAIFNECFLRAVRRAGRVNELWLGASYNLRRKRPFESWPMALHLLRRGKLPVLPERVRDLREVFERILEEGGR